MEIRMLHIKLFQYGSLNTGGYSNAHASAEQAIQWYREHTPLQFTTEWIFTDKRVPKGVNDLNPEYVDFNPLKPVSTITMGFWEAPYGIKSLGLTWPIQEIDSYQTVLATIPYDYPALADGRTSWNPAFGEGFANNFMACVIHEFAHVIRYLGALTEPKVDDLITDIHLTNNDLERINPRVNSVDKALYYLGKITPNQLQRINSLAGYMPNPASQWVIFKTLCTPANVTIKLGTSLAPINNNATYQFHPGNYAWEVSAPGYETQSGTIVLSYGADFTLAVNLTAHKTN